jgi:hypothetical protein
MRRLAAALVLFACVARVTVAQEATLTEQPVAFASATPDDSVDVLVLDHQFTGSPEFVRLFLHGKQVYRAELSTSDVTLELRAPLARLQLPRVYPIFTPAGSGASEVELYTEDDGVYELRPIGMAAGGVATRLRLFRDADESRRRMALRGNPGWEIGIELAGGWNGGYAQSQDARVVAAGGEPGSDLEFCFAARRAPGLTRLSMCALGLGHQSQHGAASILWVFTEPRIRVLGPSTAGRSNWELGVLFRAGLGNVAGRNVNPVMLAPGLYVARHIRTAPDGRGWSLHASWARAWYRGFTKPLDSWNPETGEIIRAEAASPESSRLLLGVGWYQ